MKSQQPADDSESDVSLRKGRPKATSRADKTAETRASIVKAALTEVVDQGYAGARLDEISKKAGVAKGTIYIHFKDKEALFEGIIRQMILPYSESMEAKAKLQPPQSPRHFLEEYLIPFVRALQADRRIDIVRLLIAEAPRFPALAEIYYRVIVEPNITRMSTMLSTCVKPEHAELKNFPQLVMAPVIAGLIWNTMFERFHPVDVEGMLRVHFGLMANALETGDEKALPPGKDS